MPKICGKYVLLFVCVFTVVARPAFASSTIVAHEEQKYFLRNGQIEKFEGQYEYTYFLDLEKNQLIRTRIYDYQSKKITPDETVYQVQNQLNSHPLSADRFGLSPSIRAFGNPDSDSAELIVIKGDKVESIISGPRAVVIAHLRRLK